MQLSARILTALAVVTLAVAYVAGAGAMPAVKAATGTIDVINVGTCYSTDTAVLDEGDCADGDSNLDDLEGYGVAGRTEAEQSSTIYATYSVDPKTSADDPRGILHNSDLLKVSIHDPGRDKRTPVLIRFAGAPATGADFATYAGVIVGDLLDEGDDVTKLGAIADTDDDGTADDPSIHPDIDGQYFASIASTTGNLVENATVSQSGNATFQIKKTTGDLEVYKPIADDAAITFFGLVGASTTLENLKNYLTRDEDGNPGVTVSDLQSSESAPWLTLGMSPPSGEDIVFKYAVYHTSEIETLIGGLRGDGYDAMTVELDIDGNVVYRNDAGVIVAEDADGAMPGMKPVKPVGFTKDEVGDADDPDDGDQLLVRVEGDGISSSQNLRLLETNRFSSRYEGYIRLTDANGRSSGDEPNWGLTADHATSNDVDGAAVIGVESGPVTIRYRDSDGNTQPLSIGIDTIPPIIQVDVPAHNAPTSDSSPEFAGTFTDDNGLREDSFQLYVDNTNDENENGTNVCAPCALDLRVDGGLAGISNPYGFVDKPSPGTTIDLRSQYQGFAPDGDSQFGVIRAIDLYKGEDDVGDNKATQAATPDDYNDGANEGEFQDSVTIDFEGTGEPAKGWNNNIDFQAFVIDVAGNVGFSDSDSVGPTFINDYGTTTTDNKRKTERYNVLGWYARHVLVLDERDPEFDDEKSVTGFYDEDDDGPLANRSGIKIVFDGAIDPASVGVDTFEVTLDEDAGGDSAQAAVVDIVVNGNLVFLLLDEPLASDATPMVGLARGQTVEDLAQNGTRASDETGEAFEVNDGISPVMSVSLSGGSGTGDGAEGPSSLTKDTITVSISSDEAVQGAPFLSVVCSNVAWSDGDGDYDLDNFVGNRDGASQESAAGSFAPSATVEDNQRVTCGDNPDEKLVDYVQTYARQGNTWEYQWRNLSGDQELDDGKLTVVAFARDKSSYVKHDTETTKLYNWSAATGEFRLDNVLIAPTADGNDNDGSVQPASGANVSEARPFVLITFDDPSTVSIDLLEVDEGTQSADGLGDNRFLYWPDGLAVGDHEVAVEAVDAAGNEVTFDWAFKVQEPTEFVIELLAGWNAISVPANPIDPSLDNVFASDGIDQVIGWDGTDAVSPWRIATKIDGAWATSDEYASLTGIEARYGYWVHSLGFLDQEVLLVGQPRRGESGSAPPEPIEIETNGGWNFVGVIDQDGDQTQKDDFGNTLEYRGTDGTSSVVAAGAYLGDYVRAYTWDPIRSRFDDLESGEDVEVGSGIWVYFPSDFDIAP